MKIFHLFIVTLLIAYTANTAAAQVPVVDSMRVDESKGDLSLYGSFGNTLGSIECDSTPLTVLSWTDSLIIANIPDSGKGSAGKVIVKINSFLSQPKILTYWKAYFLHSYEALGAYIYQGDSRTIFSFRYELESVFRLAPTKQFVVQTIRGSKTYKEDLVYYHGNLTSAKFDTSENTMDLIFDVLGKQIISPLFDSNNNKVIFLLDSSLQILYGIRTAPDEKDEWNELEFKFPPLYILSKVNLSQGSRNTIQVFPNPALGLVTIEYYLFSAGTASFTFSDERGTIISKVSTQFEDSGEHQMPFDGSALANGVYYVTLATPQGSETSKFIVEK